MKVIHDYSDMWNETMTVRPPHPIEAVVNRLVKKGVLTIDVAQRFLQETR